MAGRSKFKMKNFKLKILVFSFLGVFLFGQNVHAQYSSYTACLSQIGDPNECCKFFRSEPMCNPEPEEDPYSDYSSCLGQIGDPNECCKRFRTEPVCNSEPQDASYEACMSRVNNKTTCCRSFSSNVACAPTIPSNNQNIEDINPLPEFIAPSPGGNPSVQLDCPSGTVSQSGLCVPQGGPTGGFANSKTLMGLLTEILKYLLYLAGAIAVLFIVIGGFQYITSSGDEEQAEKGRKTLTNAIIGLVVVIMSYAIIQIITNAVTKAPGT